MAIGILYLSIGAIFGAILRFLITHYSSELSHHHGFPYGTLLVNVLGSLLVGYILTWSADHEDEGVWALSGQPLLNNFLCVLAVVLEMRIHNCHVTIQKTLCT